VQNQSESPHRLQIFLFGGLLRYATQSSHSLEPTAITSRGAPVTVSEAFPKRPLELPGYQKRPNFVMVVIAIVYCAQLARFLIFGYVNAVPLVDDYRLHAGGTAASYCRVENYDYRPSGRGEFFGGTVKFDARYMTASNESFDRHIEFRSLFEPHFNSVFLVKYDPASPEHISTSWGTELLPSRTILLMLVVAVSLIMIAFAAIVVNEMVRRRRKLVAIASRPIAVEADLSSVEAHKYSVKMRYTWNDSAGRLRNGSFEFTSGREPFWLDAAQSKLLALAEPGGESVLLDSALAWVNLTNAERAQILNARTCTAK
jgi:hypothetical protein